MLTARLLPIFDHLQHWEGEWWEIRRTEGFLLPPAARAAGCGTACAHSPGALPRGWHWADAQPAAGGTSCDSAWWPGTATTQPVCCLGIHLLYLQAPGTWCIAQAQRPQHPPPKGKCLQEPGDAHRVQTQGSRVRAQGYLGGIAHLPPVLWPCPQASCGAELSEVLSPQSHEEKPAFGPGPRRGLLSLC